MKRIVYVLVLLASTYSWVGHASLVSEPVQRDFEPLTDGSSGTDPDALAVTFPIPTAKIQSVDYFTSAARVPATVESMSQVLQLAGDKRRADSQGPAYIGNTDELRVKTRATALPEPSVWLLLATGLVALGLSRRRSRES